MSAVAVKRARPGDRIELVSMPNDPDPIPPGTRGTIEQVQRFGDSYHVDVRWDAKRSLALVVPPDEFLIIGGRRND